VGECFILVPVVMCLYVCFFFFSSRRRHTRSYGDWSSGVCSSDLKHLSAYQPLLWPYESGQGPHPSRKPGTPLQQIHSASHRAESPIPPFDSSGGECVFREDHCLVRLIS